MKAGERGDLIKSMKIKVLKKIDKAIDKNDFEKANSWVHLSTALNEI